MSNKELIYKVLGKKLPKQGAPEEKQAVTEEAPQTEAPAKKRTKK